MDRDDEDFQQPSESDLAALASQMPSFESLDSVSQTVDPATAVSEEQDDDAEESFEFNLFSRSTVSKVVLKDDQVETYVITVRPPSYYTHKPTPQQAEEYKQAAIDYETIVAHSQIPWPFCRRSERVSHLTKDGTPLSGSKAERTTRWRPSKTRRNKFKALKAAEAARQERLARMKKASWRTGPSRPRGPEGLSAKTVQKSSAAKSGAPGGYPRKGAPPV